MLQILKSKLITQRYYLYLKDFRICLLYFRRQRLSGENFYVENISSLWASVFMICLNIVWKATFDYKYFHIAQDKRIVRPV